jgi:hypothetical protein
MRGFRDPGGKKKSELLEIPVERQRVRPGRKTGFRWKAAILSSPLTTNPSWPMMRILPVRKEEKQYVPGHVMIREKTIAF